MISRIISRLTGDVRYMILTAAALLGLLSVALSWSRFNDTLYYCLMPALLYVFGLFEALGSKEKKARDTYLAAACFFTLALMMLFYLVSAKINSVLFMACTIAIFIAAFAGRSKGNIAAAVAVLGAATSLVITCICIFSLKMGFMLMIVYTLTAILSHILICIAAFMPKSQSK